MKYGALVEAALLDQERRVLAAAPAAFRTERKSYVHRNRECNGEKLPCVGNCGREEYRSRLSANTKAYRCTACGTKGKRETERAQRKAVRARVEASRPGGPTPRCSCGRRFQWRSIAGGWYCTNGRCKTG